MNSEKITSRQNPKIIAAVSLRDKKNRDTQGLFCLEGIKLFQEALLCGVELTSVFFTEKAGALLDECLDIRNELSIPFYEVADSVYEKLTLEQSPQGIFAIANQKKAQALPETCGETGYIIMEDIQNPSNVGTIIRTAVGLGANRILITERCADLYNPKTIRAAMGALFRAELYVTDDLLHSIATIKKTGSRVLGAALTDTALPLTEITFTKTDSIVFGNEGNGITEAVLASCNASVIIPMQCGTESLNAASAAAIMIWEKQKSLINRTK